MATSKARKNVRRSLVDWLCFMRLTPAGHGAELDRYIGYWKPYATSHDDLDADSELHAEVRNAAMILLAKVRALRAGGATEPVRDLVEVRQK
jgi:hypothetical protein